MVTEITAVTVDSRDVKADLPELRLVRDIRTANVTDRTAVRVDLTVTADVLDIRADRTVDRADLTAADRAADSVEVRAGAMHHQLTTLQQTRQQLRRSLLERNRLTAAKIKKKLLTKTSSLKQRRRLKLQQA